MSYRYRFGLANTHIDRTLKASDWTPKPPPRSKRNSRMGSQTSLLGSTEVNAKELSEKLKILEHPVHVGPNAPKRPPRFKRDKRIRKRSCAYPIDQK